LIDAVNLIFQRYWSQILKMLVTP